MIRTALLPLDQIERLREAGGPLADVDLRQFELEALPVVEIDGRVVAYWPVFYALHLEPLWIAEDYRRSPAVVRLLLKTMQDLLVSINKPVAFAVIDPATPISAMADRLGFARVPGDLYYVTLPAETPVEV